MYTWKAPLAHSSSPYPGNNPAGEGSANLLDGVAATKWLDREAYINAVYFATNAVSELMKCPPWIPAWVES